MKTSIALGVVAGLLAIAGLAYAYAQTRAELLTVLKGDGQAQKIEQEVSEVTTALGKLVMLPDETPVVATITDIDHLLTESNFYQGAVNGDKLVLYPVAQRAYVFSPSRNKVVNVGPLVLESDSQTEAQPSPTPAPTSEDEV